MQTDSNDFFLKELPLRNYSLKAFFLRVHSHHIPYLPKQLLLNLRRLGCKINYYLTSERYKIDFLVTTAPGQKKFFQVVWDGQNANTIEREEKPLEPGMKELKIEGEIIIFIPTYATKYSFIRKRFPGKFSEPNFSTKGEKRSKFYSKGEHPPNKEPSLLR